MAKKTTPAAEQPEDSALNELFLDEIKDVYWAELHLAKTLPKMAEGTTSEDLKKAFENQLKQSTTHIERLEQAFKTLDEKAEAEKCEAMNGLLKEAEELQEDTDEGTLVRDVALISAGQKIIHYKIASYGTIKTVALTLGEKEVADLLTKTLKESKATDELLTKIAESHINADAAKEKE
ncbi:MAG: ferritin-like domain-containing protein [Sphingobacteriaceae bacterium]|nr:MAG: ferritin-like domain-containing protein [Sphingobacteriaceae bacterium]